MDNMINDLLAYSKVSAETREFNQINSEEVLQETLINLKVQIEEVMQL